MKVTTGLKSGDAIDSALWMFDDIVQQGKDFLSAADKQADDVVAVAGNTASSLWQSMLGLFR